MNDCPCSFHFKVLHPKKSWGQNSYEKHPYFITQNSYEPFLFPDCAQTVPDCARESLGVSDVTCQNKQLTTEGHLYVSKDLKNGDLSILAAF